MARELLHHAEVPVLLLRSPEAGASAAVEHGAFEQTT